MGTRKLNWRRMPTISGVNFVLGGGGLKPWKNAKKFAENNSLSKLAEKFAGDTLKIHPKSALQNLGLNIRSKISRLLLRKYGLRAELFQFVHLKIHGFCSLCD